MTCEPTNWREGLLTFCVFLSRVPAGESEACLHLLCFTGRGRQPSNPRAKRASSGFKNAR